jgi:hypothetical protein
MISIIIRYSQRLTALLLAAMFAVSAGLAQERVATLAPAQAAPMNTA